MSAQGLSLCWGHPAGDVLELRSRSNDAAEAALLAPMRDPPLPGGVRPVYTSHMEVDSYQVRPGGWAWTTIMRVFRVVSAPYGLTVWR